MFWKKILKLLFITVEISAGVDNSLYRDISYDNMELMIKGLRNSFNRTNYLFAHYYSEIKTAKELFDIDPSIDGKTIICSPSIIRISDICSLKIDSSRPQILISGEIHGDERVGPSASVLTSQLLIWSAECMIDQISTSCDSLSSSFPGLTVFEKNWMAFLATRRDTYIIPTANCLGYIQNRREDNGIDPNRDFPYSRNNNNCLLSNTAKIFAALMLSSMIQIVTTYHGGMVAIGYEWGSKNHMSPKDSSPDDYANRDIGIVMKKFGGSFKGEKPYPIGRINSMVYPVDGGMEDWLYAGGWDQETNKQCRTNIPKYEKLVSSKPDNRALVFLVETSDHKKPSGGSLGYKENVLDDKASQNGHVPRNIRLTLISIDMVQPYVCFNKIKSNLPIKNVRNSSIIKKNNHQHSLQIEANRKLFNSKNKRKNKIQNNHNSNNNIHRRNLPLYNIKKSTIDLEWYIGGSRNVNRTFLSWHLPITHHHSSSDMFNCGSPLSDYSNYHDTLLSKEAVEIFESNNNQDVNKILEHFELIAKKNNIKVADRSANLKLLFPIVATNDFSGSSRWFNNDNRLSDIIHPSVLFNASIRPTFQMYITNDKSKKQQEVNLLNNEIVLFPPGRYWLVAWTVVDQSYGNKGQGYPFDSYPQSHLANARTNTNWNKQNGDKVVKGRKYWPSDPISVIVREDMTYSIETQILHCAWWSNK